MFNNHLKIVYRNLWKHKTFSLVNIMGFAFSYAVCLAILLFIINEQSYDVYHENIDNLYRLIDIKENSSTIDYRVKDILVNHYPEIENGCFMLQSTQNVNTIYNDNTVTIDNILSADNNFFDLFTVPFVKGKNAKPLQNINSVILTESSAKKIFGNEEGMGEIITIWTKTQLIVTGIIKDFPENSSINAGMIVNAENDDFKFNFNSDKDSSSYRYPFNIYLQLKDNVDVEQLKKKINENPDVLYPYEKQVAFLVVKDMYLHDYSHGSGIK
jgi:putative ABC transport system permease protein